MMGPACGLSWGTSGARPARWTELLQIPDTATCRGSAATPSTGPVDGVAADPRYLDVSVPPGVRRSLPVERTHHAFAYVFEGSGSFRDASQPQAVATERVTDTGDEVIDRVGNRGLVLFDRGDEVTVQAGKDGIRFLLVSGKPLEEPVAWRGPIVMNTREELQQAYAELWEGTFVKAR